MELKYYLRGLGLGIVITAIIMGIVSSRSSAMTDEEIIARAKQLGMIEDRVLSEAAQEENESLGTDSADDVKAAADDGVTAADENEPAEKDSFVQPDVVQNENALPDGDTQSDGNDVVNEPEETNAAEDTSAAVLPDDEETGQEEMPEETAQPENADSDAAVVVTVGNGDGSYTVSKKLEDAGVVASASAFDTFLCENGYDKKIRAGSYTIPANAGDEQIARMITGLE
ncbi:MAG: endolytic transglycosylase MltG [Lachnospiraceae bacterium]|nr:endolytic transglycosylase MltG [Lachnospiraceae bacterium]